MIGSTGGIAGFHGSGDETLLRALAAALAHRGAEEEVRSDGKAGLAARADNPEFAADPSGAVAVADGPPGVAAAALARYAEGGAVALGSLGERFAVALYDPAADALVLARDAEGRAPLYWAASGGGTVFASEPIALLAAGAVVPRPDLATVRRFVVTGLADDGEATFFAGISQVRAGHAVTITDTGSASTPLVAPAAAPVNVAAAVASAFAGAERPATRLGSGLPGAVLVAGAPSEQAVFSANYGPLDPSENAYADAVLPVIAPGTPHGRVDVNADTLASDLAVFLIALGEPVASLEAYVQYAVARAAASAGADVLADPSGAVAGFGLPEAGTGKKARKSVDPETLVGLPATGAQAVGADGQLRRAADRTSARFGIEVRTPFAGATGSPADLRAALPQAAVAAAETPRPTAPARDWLLRLKNRIYGVFMEESFVNRAWFHQQPVMVAFEDFIKGRNSDADLFWRIWSVEMWAREFFDPKPAEDDAPVRVKGPLEPNVEKRLEITVGSERWIRFPVRTELFTEGDPYQERITEYVRATVEAAAADERYASAFTKPWYLLVSEKIVAISQGRSYFIWDIEPSWWARTLSKFVVRTPYGIGLGSPWTMELAIREAGLSRILLASGISAAGKAVGKRGLFYQIAGHSVRAIDGPTEYSVFPANVSAKLAPAKPDKVAAELTGKVTDGLRAAGLDGAARALAGVVVIDANDIGRNVLGQASDRPDAFFEELFGDNPLGQGSEQTPLAVAIQAP
jgi:asparagine synthase (glutamine-hydrolysing)